MEPASTSRSTRAVSRLAWQSAAYSLGNLGLKVAGLLLLPLFLDPARLPIADYGYLGLIETAAQLTIAVAGLGIASGLLRYTAGPTDQKYEDYVGTAFATSVLAAVAAAGLVWLLAEPLAALLAGDGARSGIVRWAGIYIAFKVVGAVPYMVMRVRERPGLYLTALLLEVSVLVGGVYVALAILDAGLEGVVMAFAVSAASAAIPLGTLVLLRTGIRFRRSAARQLLRFGMPLTVAALAGILLNTGDRFVLEALAGPEMLAVYVLATKFGGLINMLFVQSFNMAFSVLGLKSIAAEGGTDLHRRVFRHFVVIAGWGVLGVGLLTRDVTMVLSPDPAYLDAEVLILPIAYGFLLYGVYYVVLNVLYAAERTTRVAGLVLAAAAINIVLNLVLIPYIGVLGAALATAASYGALAGLALLDARRAMPLKLPWHVLLTITLVIAGLWALAQPTIFWDSLPRLGVRLALIAAYPALILAFGVYSWQEVRSIFGLIARRGRE